MSLSTPPCGAHFTARAPDVRRCFSLSRPPHPKPNLLMGGDVEEEVLVLRRRVLGAVRARVAQHHQNGPLGIGLLQQRSKFIISSQNDKKCAPMILTINLQSIVKCFPLIRPAVLPNGNWPYKRDCLMSEHFLLYDTCRSWDHHRIDHLSGTALKVYPWTL